MQEALWRREQVQSAASPLDLLTAFRLKGHLDRGTLGNCVEMLTGRHESLGDAFLYEELPGRRSGRLVRVCIPTAAMRVADSLAAELQTALDPAAGGLFRVVLISNGPQDHILVLRASRLVADETALGILIEELGELYGAAVEGKRPRLPACGRSYSEFAEWCCGQLEETGTAQAAGALPAVQLPVDHSRARSLDGSGAELRFGVPAENARRAEELAQRLEVSVEDVFLAAFTALLMRYTGEEDVVVGAIRDLRASGGFEGLVGCCSDTVLLRTDLAGRPEFEEAVKRVHASRSAVLTGTLPCQVRFEWQQRPPAELRLPGLTVTALASQVECELVLRMWREGDGYTGAIRYRKALFDGCTIADFCRHYLAILAGGTEQPRQPVPDIPILEPAERQRIVEDWNGTKADYPRDITVQQLFERRVEQSPEAVGLTCGETNLTYRELNERANRLARYLVSQGAGQGTLVGLSVPRSPEMIVAILAVLKTGAAYVPLDPSYPEQRLVYMIEDSGMPLVITNGNWNLRLPGKPIRVVDLSSEAGDLNAQDASDFTPARSGSEDLAFILYTSGSTGKPKGVPIQHRSVVNFLYSMMREPGLSAEDVLLAVTTLSFDMACFELYLPLVVGARVVLATSDEVVNGGRLQELIDAESVTAMQATPATWRLLLEAGWRGNARLKLITGGEALTRQLADDLLERCASLWNGYGPTEATVYATICNVERGDKPVLIGHPVANAQAMVLDGHRQPVPVGVAGELYIGGDGLMQGYWNKPELTAEALVAVDGALLYKTGDLVRFRRDGNLEYIGRVDQQVKWHGFRIELGEIEAALVRHPDIAAGAAILREDVPGRKQLVAYLVSRRTPGPTARELRGFLGGLLPHYMIPSVFVSLAAFPHTPSGKIDRRALPAPSGSRPELEETYVAPRTNIQRRLVAIWQEVLGIRSIGIRDNYFDLGAESLITAQLFVRIEREFHRRIAPTALFQAPTIEQLSGLLTEETKDSPWSCLVPVVARGTKPPLFCIHGGAGTILFFYDMARHLGDDRPIYALQAQGLYGGPAPHSTVEEMARQYLREMRAVQERGPYFLAGYCFGAIVAYEMAQILRESGEEVAMLASLNGPGPRYRNVPPGDPSLRGLRKKLRTLRGYLRAVRRRTDRWHVEYCRRRNLPVPARLRDRYFLVNNHRAEYLYSPKPYPGNMVIFKAKGLYRDACLGWADLVQGGFSFYEIPGRHLDHRSMMEEPLVKLLAEEMRQELQK